MALIKRSQSDPAQHRAIALDLGDLGRRAELMREAAAAEAERVIAEAHRERDRIISGAAEEGRATGFAEGREAGLAEGREAGRAAALAETRERLSALEESWAALIEDFEGRREAILIESRRAVVELAVAVAERVVHRKIEVDPDVVVEQVREVLALVAAPTSLLVRIHPDDEPLVREVLPQLRERLAGGVHVRLSQDETISRGSCVARTMGGAVIDGAVETQLARLVRDLLPGRVEDAS